MVFAGELELPGSRTTPAAYMFCFCSARKAVAIQSCLRRWNVSVLICLVLRVGKSAHNTVQFVLDTSGIVNPSHFFHVLVLVSLSDFCRASFDLRRGFIPAEPFAVDCSRFITFVYIHPIAIYHVTGEMPASDIS